jgi:hypothetical protein
VQRKKQILNKISASQSQTLQTHNFKKWKKEIYFSKLISLLHKAIIVPENTLLLHTKLTLWKKHYKFHSTKSQNLQKLQLKKQHQTKAKYFKILHFLHLTFKQNKEKADTHYIQWQNHKGVNILHNWLLFVRRKSALKELQNSFFEHRTRLLFLDKFMVLWKKVLLDQMRIALVRQRRDRIVLRAFWNKFKIGLVNRRIETLGSEQIEDVVNRCQNRITINRFRKFIKEEFVNCPLSNRALCEYYFLLWRIYADKKAEKKAKEEKAWLFNQRTILAKHWVGFREGTLICIKDRLLKKSVFQSIYFILLSLIFCGQL